MSEDRVARSRWAPVGGDHPNVRRAVTRRGSWFAIAEHEMVGRPKNAVDPWGLYTLSFRPVLHAR